MRIGALLAVVWIIIGLVAAGQRGYFSGDEKSCSDAGNTILTIVAGPLNYVGINPKITCEAPQPSP
ncbi:hypothetical protein [Catelliglobosispora koreensis]|uniref:hypothetical protein n=1 Tax=Catelliglobosispora koreensis TaxID=129052 RepID=UPI00037DB541|nr:hypothetical protein [Catelliglobosispora koreensis]